jgi:hypothetical protein
MKTGRMKRTWLVVGAVIAVALVTFSGIALATMGSGVTAVTVAQARLSDPIGPGMYNVDGIMVKTKGPVDLVTQVVTFKANGGTAGWHAHAGPVFVSVISGTLTTYDADCIKHTYGPGSVLNGPAFFEAGPHHDRLVRNEGTVDAVVYAWWIVPPGTPLNMLRIDRPDPGCNISDPGPPA